MSSREVVLMAMQVDEGHSRQLNVLRSSQASVLSVDSLHTHGLICVADGA